MSPGRRPTQDRAERGGANREGARRGGARQHASGEEARARDCALRPYICNVISNFTNIFVSAVSPWVDGSAPQKWVIRRCER